MLQDGQAFAEAVWLLTARVLLRSEGDELRWCVHIWLNTWTEEIPRHYPCIPAEQYGTSIVSFYIQ